MRLAALALLAAAGCASTSLAPRTGRHVAVEEPDEQGMWRLAGEAQAELDRSGRVVADPALEAYLDQVARRLQPPEVFAAIPFRIRVLRDRTPNAFCLPNGAVYLHTGMLALIESEAELAALLGHEMSHAVHRHALRGLHDAQNSGALLNALGSWAGAGARPGGLILMASVAGYSRGLEREADREGLARVVAAGYDPRQAARLFERLRDWSAAEQVPRGSAFYASHPELTERIESFRALAAQAAGGEVGREAFGAQAAGILLEAARSDLAGGRFAPARGLAERFVALRPEDARGHLALAEIARREGGPGREEAALAGYRRALQLDAGAAEAWRGLGLLLRRRGDAAGARAALTRYLSLAPTAPDRAMVGAVLKDLPGGTP